MYVYLSMVIWILLMRMFGTSGMQFGTLPNGAQYYKVGKWVSFLTMAYLVFWIGMRTGFVDTGAYIRAFKRSPGSLSLAWDILLSDRKGMGWYAILYSFKALVSSSYRAWLLFLACVMGFSVSATYRRYSEAFALSMLVFVLSGNFTWLMNGMRQCLCATTLLLALPWLIQGKTVKYMLLIAALSLVHFSVWIMVPVYFVVRQRPWGKITLLAIVATSVACWLAVPLAGEVEEALESTSYAGSTVFKKGDDGVHPLRVLPAAVPALLGLLLKKRMEEENNPVLNIGVNMSLLTALLYLFGVYTSGILMGRLPFYCELYAAITLPMLIHRIPDATHRKMLTVACVVCYALNYYVAWSKGMYYISDITGLVPA